MESLETILHVRDLTLIKEDRIILDNVNIQVKKGEVCAILGDNGAGKSSMAYTIMGLSDFKPTRGRIIFLGQDISLLSINERAKRGISLAWQEPTRFEGLQVKDYLTLSCKDNPTKYLEMVGLDGKKYLERAVDNSLSGGERKRIELASILSLKPKLVILDEPDSGIDILGMGYLKKIIDGFKLEGSSILLITHQRDVLQLADSAYLLCNGRVNYQGEAKEVTKYYRAKCSKCSEGGKNNGEP